MQATTHTIPQDLFQVENLPEMNLFDYFATEDHLNSKVILRQHVISFLVHGQKKIHFSNDTIEVDNQYAVMMASGNCLMSECLGENNSYQSVLLFFSPENLSNFFLKYPQFVRAKAEGQNTFFVLEQDLYIQHLVASLRLYLQKPKLLNSVMLSLKWEEIMLFLIDKYGESFLVFLQDLLHNPQEVSFRKVIEDNLYTNLNLEELAFLCNMSLSTFKRHFTSIYHESPGKWLQAKRLDRAKEMLSHGEMKASEIYQLFGYENLSNFSAAFKQQFGVSPRQIA
ncbi:MAG: helix-turn-helix domain-containing protein [Flectobacillus sp.]|uniref:helix-turn-helix domain-containing protein n=1 Tax=Flectobacillus sp. TaxID=50419 RepID=UPI003B9DA5B2